MSADLLLVWAWTGIGVELDFEAGRQAARELDADACIDLAAQRGQDDTEVDFDEMRLGVAVGLVDVLAEHMVSPGSYSSDLVFASSPDGEWTCWIAGGTSYGESPNALFDALRDLWSVPQVLAAIGFETEVSPR